MAVYLDSSASTQLLPEAREALKNYYDKEYALANANALHSFGRANNKDFEAARKNVAKALGAHMPSEIIFTGGGTEADNFALYGLSVAKRNTDGKRTKVIISNFEHGAIASCVTPLKLVGFDLEYVEADRYGFIEPEALEKVMSDEVALVSIMLTNNELGTVQPIQELAQVAHKHGALFHTDAIQGFTHVPFNVEESGVDAASITAHKFGGPIGIGALYLRRGTQIQAFLYGGGQEHGKRSGTQDVAGALAMAAAAKYQIDNFDENFKDIKEKSDYIYKRLCESGKFVRAVELKDGKTYHPGMVAVFCITTNSEDLLLKLDEAGFYVSAGSACSAGSLEMSKTMKAIKANPKLAQGQLRISFDERISFDDIKAFCDCILELA